MKNDNENIVYYLGSEDEYNGLRSFFNLEKFHYSIKHVASPKDFKFLKTPADAILVSEDAILNNPFIKQTIKDNILFKDTPVISILTKANAKNAHNLNVDDFICMPFVVDELYLRIIHTINYTKSLQLLEQQREKIDLASKKHRERTIELFGRHIDLKKAQKEIALKNKRIQHQHNEIQASIRYASLIQNAILPHEEEIKEIIEDYFLVNIPKAIVSGDFYWVGEKKGKKYLIAADCTGHGVPGAFMSILGMGAINEILYNDKEFPANKILADLRNYIIRILHQKGNIGEASDGMDMSLCIVDYETLTIEYAGAHNPLYHIHKGEICLYKADRMTLGITRKTELKEFTNNIIPFKKGDIIYLFSDGFADQFGGPTGSKYRYKNFREFLFRIHKFPMSKQKLALIKEFQQWKGEYDQIDDILILGVRL
ncbi:MAG: SpoIIE family protein phosphatase [Bacteroidales bacterium]|nr:SpoIIE family protein phosphatase [Bacteroidales bacterium]